MDLFLHLFSVQCKQVFSYHLCLLDSILDLSIHNPSEPRYHLEKLLECSSFLIALAKIKDLCTSEQVIFSSLFCDSSVQGTLSTRQESLHHIHVCFMGELSVIMATEFGCVVSKQIFKFIDEIMLVLLKLREVLVLNRALLHLVIVLFVRGH